MKGASVIKLQVFFGRNTVIWPVRNFLLIQSPRKGLESFSKETKMHQSLLQHFFDYDVQ